MGEPRLPEARDAARQPDLNGSLSRALSELEP